MAGITGSGITLDGGGHVPPLDPIPTRATSLLSVLILADGRH